MIPLRCNHIATKRPEIAPGPAAPREGTVSQPSSRLSAWRLRLIRDFGGIGDQCVSSNEFQRREAGSQSSRAKYTSNFG
jgi:hypothetical protein